MIDTATLLIKSSVQPILAPSMHIHFVYGIWLLSPQYHALEWRTCITCVSLWWDMWCMLISECLITYTYIMLARAYRYRCKCCGRAYIFHVLFCCLRMTMKCHILHLLFCSYSCSPRKIWWLFSSTGLVTSIVSDYYSLGMLTTFHTVLWGRLFEFCFCLWI